MTTVEEAAGAANPGPENPAPPAKPPKIILVAADKGGVGKTTISLTLIDYLLKGGISVRAFDTEPEGPVLKRRYPAAHMLKAESVDGQRDLVDAATSAAVTVVDCKAGLLSPIIRVFTRIRLLRDVQARKLGLTVLHVIGPTVASAQEVEPVLAGLRGANVIQVRNMTNPDAKFPAPVPNRVTITIPYLPEEAAEDVDQAGIMFAAYAANPKFSRVLTGYVEDWETQVHAAYDSASLPALIQRD